MSGLEDLVTVIEEYVPGTSADDLASDPDQDLIERLASEVAQLEWDLTNVRWRGYHRD